MSTKDIGVILIQDTIAVPTLGKRSRVVTGFDKLYSNVVKYIATAVGSDPFDKAYGTELPALVGQAGSGDPAFIEDVIEESLERTRIYFAAKAENADIAGEPLDDSETLLGLELVTFEILVDYVRIYVNITNNLGEDTAVSIVLD